MFAETKDRFPHTNLGFAWSTPRADAAALALAGVALLVGLRFALAASLPLSFDEAYYWLWSKHPAAGYFDHPAAIAFAIRAGTALFGDTDFGVRFVSLLASLGASWAVWRAAAIVLRDDTAAAVAVLIFNTTLMIAAESLAATPDALLIAATALLLWTIAELERTQNGRWWLAAGGAAGCALAAKYTGLFLFGSVGIWLLARAVRGARGRENWLVTPWPYAGAGLALVLFAPTLWWNAGHGFVSFRFQFGRVASGHFGTQYLLEFVAGQLALASPGVLALAAIAAWSSVRARAAPRLPLWLMLLVCLPLGYFAMHSLHDRVQANWPCFVYPGLAVLAAAPFARAFAQSFGRRRAVRLVRRAAIPLGLVIVAAATAQAFWGVAPMGRSDPVARMMGVGFPAVAKEIAADAQRIGARAILTTNYPVTAWLRFYDASRLPVIQIGDDVRFLSAPAAPRDLLAGTTLYVTQRPAREMPLVRARYSRASFLGRIVRSRGGRAIDTFDAFALAGFHGAAVGREP